MIDRKELLTAIGVRLDQIGELLNPPLERSAEVKSLGGRGSMHITFHESDDAYRARLVQAFDSIKDGGPAFGEFKQAGDCSIKQGGLSIRDYFAAKAMQGYNANPGYGSYSLAILADMAYQMADAMLAERAK